VSDVQVPSRGFTSEYPLAMGYDTLEQLFLKPRSATSALFSTLMMIAVSCLPHDVFEASVEGAFGALAVFDSFRNYWPRANPYELLFPHTSPVFNAIYESYSKCERRLYPSAFQALRMKGGNEDLTQADKLNIFIGELKAGAPDREWNSLSKLLKNPEAAQARVWPLYSPGFTEADLLP
jgi:hypothetical protein